MATKYVTLKDSDGNTLYPQAVATNLAPGSIKGDEIDWPTIPIQCGNTYIDAGWSTITFSRPFSTVPVVSATLETGTAETATATFIKIASVSTTGFRVAVGTASGFGTGNINWIATTLNKN